MNVLCHGAPFCCDWPLLRAYTGAHDIRVLGFDASADYPYDPALDDATAIVNRIRRDWPVDLLLCWTPEIYPPPSRIEDAPVTTAACISDWNVYFDPLADNLRRFDRVLCDKAGAAVFQRIGLPARHVTPLYSEVPGVHTPGVGPKRWDIVFAGNLDPLSHRRRNAFLERLAAMDGEWRIAIRGGLDPEAYGAFLASSRAVFNHSIRGELNLRAFETAACGACPLIEAENLEVGECFDPERDVVLYSDEAFESDIEALLADDAECARRADNARAVAPALSGAARFDTVIDACAHGPGQRTFHGLSPFDRAFADAEIYALGRDRRCFARAWAAWRIAKEAEPRRPETAALEAQLRLHPFHPEYGAAAGTDAALRALYEAHRADRTSAVYALNAALGFRLAGKDSMERRCVNAALEAGASGGRLLAGPHPSTAIRWRRARAEDAAALTMLHAEARFQSAQLQLRGGEPAAALAEARECARIDPDHQEWPIVAVQAAVALGDLPAALAAADAAVERMPLRLEFREVRKSILEAIGRPRDANAEARKIERMRRRLATPA